MLSELENFEPYWLDEKDWLLTLIMVDLDDPEEKAEAGEVIGYLYGYASLTNTRMLALIGDPEMITYELLFSFDTPEHKHGFLRMVDSNELTHRAPEEWMTPEFEEIRDARPLGHVIPDDIMQYAQLIAVPLMSPLAEGDGPLN